MSSEAATRGDAPLHPMDSLEGADGEIETETFEDKNDQLPLISFRAPKLIKQLAAEMVGTGVFVFVGASCIANVNNPIFDRKTQATLLAVALAHGLTITTMIYTVGPISGGHLNPAVTFSLLITRRIKLLSGLLYILFQMVGGIIGAGLVLGVSPHAKDADHGRLGSFGLGGEVTTLQALVAEVVTSFILVLTVWGTAVRPNHPDNQGTHFNFLYAGLAIGLAVAIDIMAIGTLTGGCMNPARHLGPALLSGNWQDAWVFYIGPLSGSALATYCYTYFLAPDKKSQERGLRRHAPRASNV